MRYAVRMGKKCSDGCTCGRHALKGGRLSPAQRAAMKCAPGCQCKKHGLRNSGQFAPGNGGFSRPHTEETKKKLAAYTGERSSAYKHGWSGTPTHTTWTSMHSRCTDPRNASYGRYGGRGITVCERWGDFTFFLADMGERPEGMTLDRIEIDRNYEPSNCRWATRAEQESNKSNPWDDPEKAALIREGQRKWKENRWPS